ncbi:MAG TPA: hypothetical protein VFZ48_03355 [Candidatus Saccharimonadales bacterium]
MDHVLIPCCGNPLREVWLPVSEEPDALEIPVGLTGRSLTRLAREHAEQKLGITERGLRLIGERRFGNATVIVLIVWLQEGDSPRNLRRVPVGEAMKDPKFGPIVTAIQQRLAEAH